MPIVCSRTTRTSDMFPGPARDSYIAGQCTIPEEQAQRCTFSLERVGAFALGELRLQPFCSEGLGTWIQLCQVLDLVDGPGPAHKTHNMGLIDRPGLERVDHPGRKCPGGFSCSEGLFFCFAATLPYRHFLFQAINRLFNNALAMC